MTELSHHGFAGHVQHFLSDCSLGTVERNNLPSWTYSYSFDSVGRTVTAAKATFHECHKLSFKLKVLSITLNYLLK